MADEEEALLVAKTELKILLYNPARESHINAVKQLIVFGIFWRRQEKHPN